MQICSKIQYTLNDFRLPFKTFAKRTKKNTDRKNKNNINSSRKEPQQ